MKMKNPEKVAQEQALVMKMKMMNAENNRPKVELLIKSKCEIQRTVAQNVALLMKMRNPMIKYKILVECERILTYLYSM
jgi:hypothetical protein